MHSDDQLRRTSAVAGAGAFILALLGGVMVADPALALLLALGAGVAVGTGAYAVGAVTALSRPLPPAAVRPPSAGGPPAPVPEAAAEAAGPLAGPPSDDTARLSPDDVVRAADLHQTIRLDQEHLDYVLPEFSPEDLFKEREGIDEQFLRAGVGIDETGTPSDNSTQAPGAAPRSEDAGRRAEGEPR